ncbi:MAG: DUF3842 family protein [Bacillota bacterium]
MIIAVIDAQGAGLGQTIIKKLRKELGNDIHIAALGTNQTATQNMLEAGADKGYTGENEICSFCETAAVSCIIGPIGIICSGGILGEITPRISGSVFSMSCTKYIMPLQKHGIYIPGTRSLQIKDIISEIVEDIKNSMGG